MIVRQRHGVHSQLLQHLHPFGVRPESISLSRQGSTARTVSKLIVQAHDIRLPHRLHQLGGDAAIDTVRLLVHKKGGVPVFIQIDITGKAYRKIISRI